jgi:hypothetical protein
MDIVATVTGDYLFSHGEKPFSFLCTCREGRLIGFKFVEVVPLENILMLRLHRLQIEIGDVRFHHVGQEQVREK